MRSPLRRLVVASLCAFGASAVFAARSLPTVDPAIFAQKYGKPDVDYSSQVEKPRPKIVTRRIEYKAEKVRFVLAADGPLGAPPPYKKWLLMGVQDTASNAALPVAEVERRMAARSKAALAKKG